MSKELNKRQLAYCYHRARDNSMEESMTKAGYTCVGGSARSVGSQLETNADITKQIDNERLNIFDTNKVNLEYLIEKTNEIALKSKHDSNRLRAIEILAKLKGLWVDRQDIDIHNFNTKTEQSEYDNLMAGLRSKGLSN